MSFLSIAAYVVSGLTIVIVNKSPGAMEGGEATEDVERRFVRITSFSLQEQVYNLFLKKQS